MAAEKSLGTCLFCVPLRLGVALIATANFFYAFVCVAVLFTGDLRLQSGGYSPYTRRLQALVGSTGIFFCLMGLIGLIDDKTNLVRNFARFLEVRLVVSLVVFVFDLVTLMRCVPWASIPANKVYNPPLYEMSSKGVCSMARLCYMIGFGIDFGTNYYLAWVTHVFCSRLAAGPGYLIRFAKGAQDHSQAKPSDPEDGGPSQYLGLPVGRFSEVYGST